MSNGLQTGTLSGTVVDVQGSALPGVTVTLTGGLMPIVQVTDALGRFRFPGLAPALYTITAQLEGFATVEYPDISVSVGRDTMIEITMSSAIKE